jgi:hypothetical protein
MTRGSELLKAHLAAHGEQQNFVNRFNEGRPEGDRIDAPMVSRWKSGKRPPAPEFMARIEDLTGIPMRAWVEPPEGNEGDAASAGADRKESA